MSQMLTRMFAYLTVVCYLVAGTLVVRFYYSDSTTLQLSLKSFNILKDAPIKSSLPIVAITVPVMEFEKTTPVYRNKKVSIERKLKIKTEQPEIQFESVKTDYELPFQENIKVSKVIFNSVNEANLVSQYKDFSFEEKVIAISEPIQDEVKSTMASPRAKTLKVEINHDLSKVEKKESVLQENEKISELIADDTRVENEPEFFDYPVVAEKKNLKNQKIAEVSLEKEQTKDLVAFDYSKAKTEIDKNIVPKVSAVSSHRPAPSVANPLIQGKEKSEMGKKENPNFPMGMTIQALGTNLTKIDELKGFEVRFQDDLSETIEDFGAGEVQFQAIMAKPKMTRSIVILKRGYAPTSTEVILEEGDGSVSIPLIEEEILNDLNIPFEQKGSVGSLLIELDDESELAKLDVPFGDVITLDGDLKRTTSKDFRYQLFLGVRSGNAMISYNRINGDVVSKIIHIHENELTFDSNFYEEIQEDKIKLFEEDLLAKENSPLIIPGEQVKVFAKNVFAKKISQNTYQINSGASHLAGRRYLEIGHHLEPVFVGIRDNNQVTVPSENFMRFILSKIEGSSLGNRCLVQVNLKKKVQKFEVGSESVASSLMTYNQVLDSDGKFYDSVSDKSKKIIIIGESQASSRLSSDAKINLKIDYVDGSTQYLNSYCSPNTYLVEQL
jgi:hypothetical protein